MSFGQAVEELKAGKKVSREGWNGMFLFLVGGGGMSHPLLGNEEINAAPYIAINIGKVTQSFRVILESARLNLFIDRTGSVRVGSIPAPEHLFSKQEFLL